MALFSLSRLEVNSRKKATLGTVLLLAGDNLREGNLQLDTGNGHGLARSLDSLGQGFQVVVLLSLPRLAMDS